MKQEYQTTPTPGCGDPQGSRVAHGSAYQRGYSRGYTASLKRIGIMKQEIALLRQLKTPLPPLPLPDSHDVTIEYLVTSAEALIGAAHTLINMRKENTPNGELSGGVTKTERTNNE